MPTTHGQYRHQRYWSQFTGYERLQRLPYLRIGEAHRLLHPTDRWLTQKDIWRLIDKLGITVCEWTPALGVPLLNGAEPWEDRARVIRRADVERVRRARYLRHYHPQLLPAQARKARQRSRPHYTAIVTRVEELLANRWTLDHDIWALAEQLVNEGFDPTNVRNTLHRLIAVGQLHYETVEVREDEPWAYHTVPRLRWKPRGQRLRQQYASGRAPAPARTCALCGETKPQAAFMRKQRRDICTACKRRQMAHYDRERGLPVYDALMATARCAFCDHAAQKTYIKDITYRAQMLPTPPTRRLFHTLRDDPAQLRAELLRREVICHGCWLKLRASEMYQRGFWKEGTTRTRWATLFTQARAYLVEQFGEDSPEVAHISILWGQY